jgi:hypothetical protein
MVPVVFLAWKTRFAPRAKGDTGFEESTEGVRNGKSDPKKGSIHLSPGKATNIQVHKESEWQI